MTPVGKALWFIESHFAGDISLGEIAKLLSTGDGKLDPADYERTVAELLSGGSDPVITKKPQGAWTHKVYDAMK